MSAPIHERIRRANPDLRAGIDAASASMIRSVAGATALMLLILAVSVPFLIDSRWASLLAAISFGSALVLGSAWRRASRSKVAGRQRVVALVIGLVAVVNVLTYMQLLQTARPTAILMLVLLGAGILLVSDLWLGAFLVGCVLAWSLVLPTATAPEVAIFYAFGLMVSAVVSTALHAAWVDRLSELTELRRRERTGHEAALDAAGRLAAGVGHDFNNLLTAVTGYADLILAGVDEEDPVRMDVDEIRRAGESGRELTDQLLALGRHPVGTPRLVDVNDVVSSTTAELGASLGPGVRVDLDLGPGPLHAELDPDALREIVMTMAFSVPTVRAGKGGIVVQTSRGRGVSPINVAVGRGSATHVYVTVLDPGAGLESQEIEEAFTFPRGAVARPDRVARAMAQGLARQSGGVAFARAEAGGGTSFNAAFPVHGQTVDESGAGTAASVPESDVRGYGESILLVEDEDVVRRLAERVLTELGYHVTSAAGGPEALKLAEEREGPFDLVLSDVVMPAMGGAEVVRRLQDQGAARKVVFMSGYAEDQVVQDAVRDSTVPFIGKPFTPGALAREIRRVLDG